MDKRKERVRVTFEVEIPDVGACAEQVEDWLRFNLNDLHHARLGELQRYSVDPVHWTFEIEWL